MSVSAPLAQASSSFKPTFVPEYFFEPASPTSGGGAHAGVAPTSSSPDSDGGGGSPPAAGEKQSEAFLGSKESSSDAVAMDCECESDKNPSEEQQQQRQQFKELPPFLFAVPPSQQQAAVEQRQQQAPPEQFLTPVLSSMQTGSGPNSAISTPSTSAQFFPQGSSGTNSSAVSQVSSPTGVSSHSAKVYQRLVDAVMADEFTAGGTSSPPTQRPPAAPDSTRKDSSTSTTSSASTGSSMATWPVSTVDSPVSPGSSAAMAGASNATSAAQTPSPPPLMLPQQAGGAGAAGHKHRCNSISSSAEGSKTPISKARVPASSPTRYRTVPAAASHISPVQLPVHTPSTAQHQQHAQTPKPDHHPHGGERTHHRHHTVSTPATPQAQPAPHPRMQESVHSGSAGGENAPEFVGPFILGPVLGRGCTGTVRLGTHRLTGFEVAFKIIDKKYLVIGEQEAGAAAAAANHTLTEAEIEQSKLWKKVKREIVVLKLISHPHILKLYDVLETENRLYLVLENVKGGELFDYIVSKGRLERHEALRICAQIVMGLEHCHAHNICHRDLKPENLLLSSDSPPQIKIADFGMAQLMKKDNFLKTSCGSPHYASPEVIEGASYDAKCTDVWSIGVILYALITGSLPFDHDNIPTLLSMVTRGHYTTPAHVPADIAHLISRMLTVDPTKRITIPEIKKHISFKGHNYFPVIESPVDLLLQRRALTSGAAPGPGHGAPPHKKQRQAARHSSSNRRDRGAANGDADDSDDEVHDNIGHAWRKRGGAGYEPAGPPAAVQHALSVGALPLSHRSRAATHALSALGSGHHGDDDDDGVDDAVLNDLESLGLGSKETNREKIRREQEAAAKEQPSLELRFYRLLRQRKMDRLRELAVLSPKISPLRPPHLRHHKPSSHHYATARGVYNSDESYIASQPASGAIAPLPPAAIVCASQPVSHLNTPTEASRHEAHRSVLADLELPPPAARPSPTHKQNSRSSPCTDQSRDAVMSDAQGSGTSASAPTSAATGETPYSGTSIMSRGGSPPSVTSGTGSSNPALVYSSIFAPASTLASSVLGLAANSISAAGPSPSPVVPAVKIGASSAPEKAGLLSPQADSRVVSSPSQSTTSAGVPVAVGAACAVAGVQVVAQTKSPSPTAASTQQPQHSTHHPPPVLRHYSDGSVPASVMNDEPVAAAFYASRLGMPALTLTMPPASSADAVPVPFGLDGSDSAQTSRDNTAPQTPAQQHGGDAEPKPSPTDYPGADDVLNELAPAGSSSANVSPLMPHQTVYERRLSVPGPEGVPHRGSGAARQLFVGGTLESSNKQVHMDHFGRPAAAASAGAAGSSNTAGPARESMELDYVAQSAPMHAQTSFISPPPFSLPPHIPVQRIHVSTARDSSGSETERMDGDDTTSQGASATGSGTSNRPRAYSQDESNHALARHQHPVDTVASNVRTPISTGMPAMPSYNTSPRFHRVHFHTPEMQSAGISSPTSGPPHGASAATGASSSRTTGNTLGVSGAAQSHMPPSPQHKKSWFSSVFGNSVSFFDRLKGGVGKRGSVNAQQTSSTQQQQQQQQQLHLPPSPNLAPSTPRSTAAGAPAVISTKRATLTLTNELGKLLDAAGVQFVHSRGYRIEASYQPNARLENFATPPPPTPLMQRALSTPGEEQSKQRARSSSIAVEAMHRGAGVAADSAAAKYAAAAYGSNVGSAPFGGGVPSTPKPTPTRSLNHPYVLQSVPTYPPSLSASPIDNDPLDLLDNSNVGLSSSEIIQPSKATAAAAAAMLETLSPVQPASASISSVMQSPPSAGFASPLAGSAAAAPAAAIASPRGRSVPSAMFGPNGVRLIIDVQESAHDTRIVTFTRKSGDVAAYQAIVNYVRPQLEHA